MNQGNISFFFQMISFNPIILPNSSFNFSQIIIPNLYSRNSHGLVVNISETEIDYDQKFYCKFRSISSLTKLSLFGTLVCLTSSIAINGLSYFEAIRQKDHAVSRMYKYLHFTILQAVAVIIKILFKVSKCNLS